MKIRNGFVSNSSSSSFLIVMKNNKELSTESLIETFKVDSTSPLFDFSKDLAKFLVNYSEKCTIASIHEEHIGSYNEEEKTTDDMINELVDEMYMDRDMLESLKNDKIKVYEGQASNEGDEPVEAYLYNSGVNFNTDEIEMKNLN